jgi:hypothetical protein
MFQLFTQQEDCLFHRFDVRGRTPGLSCCQKRGRVGYERGPCGLFSQPPSGRVEGRRACCRWRVSSPALSIAGWVHNSTMATFPAPATSNAACGFPALRFPACFVFRVMGPIALGALAAVADCPDSCSTTASCHTAPASSPASSHSPGGSAHASDAAAPSLPPRL